MALASHHALVHAQRGVTRCGQVAELASRALERRIIRQALGAQIGHAHIEMRGDLVVDVASRVATEELEVAEPFAHDGCSSARSTLFTAPTKLSHDDRSSRS